MSDPMQPQSGNLFLAVTAADGSVHSTLKAASTGNWSTFDTVTPLTQPGRKNVDVTVTPYGQVMTVDDSLMRQLRYTYEPPTWAPAQRLATGIAPAVTGGQASSGLSLAALGVGNPTVAGWSFGLPLLLLTGGKVVLAGDQLADIDAGELDPADLAVALDSDGFLTSSERSFEICLVTASGGLFYTRVFNYGGHPFGPRPRFLDVKAVSGDPGPLLSVSCAQNGSGLQVCVVDESGTIHHAIRDSARGTWTPFGDVNAATGSTDRFVQVAVSGYNGDFGSDPLLHVAGVTESGGIRHTVRHADGTWDPFFDVTTAAGNPGAATSVDIGAWPWLIP